MFCNNLVTFPNDSYCLSSALGFCLFDMPKPCFSSSGLTSPASRKQLTSTSFFKEHLHAFLIDLVLGITSVSMSRHDFLSQIIVTRYIAVTCCTIQLTPAYPSHWYSSSKIRAARASVGTLVISYRTLLFLSLGERPSTLSFSHLNIIKYEITCYCQVTKILSPRCTSIFLK